jgi:hypothetical protein
MSKTATPEEIEATMLALLEERGPGRAIGPADVAQILGGNQPDGWGPLMQPVRKVVNPDDFRGTYRLALPPAES